MYKTYYFVEGGPAGDPFATSGARATALLDARLPGATGATLSRPLAEQIDPAASPPFSGIAELWHVDRADALAAEGRAAVEALLAADARIAAVYAGLARTVMRLPAHHGGGGVKCVFPFCRKPGMSLDAFRRRWWHGHGPIAAQTEDALFYLQCHPLDEAYAGAAVPRFDGITELHFPSLSAARGAMGSRQMRVDQGNDAPHFAAAGSVLLFAVAEETLRAP